MDARIVSLVILHFLLGMDVVISTSSGDNPAYTLYFGVFISQGSDFDFSGFIPPLELGVMTINNDQTVLKGLNGMDYSIVYKPIADSKVRTSRYLRMLISYTATYMSAGNCVAI